ncbi:5'-3' exonuclease [Clostridium chromiireducens]|uniref:5'-3' exonuclease n=1 Tax=Clostridium chromiireducens TaxID=225345 RepID=A0A964W5M6_9CLOT|nr:5'-3' exonuclease H3TH domain-containing protein [Clostridium chromiireducens]MVX67448.1 5'-3' exonuclease [Clostridium chromiireducens]
MNKHLLLIDGSSLLSCCFFGNLPKEYKFAKTDEEKDKYLNKIRQSPQGEFTNGVFTMMAAMLKVIRNQRPTHMVVAWDRTKEFTFRKELFPDYKGHRKEFRSELSNQFALAQKVLKDMGIAQFLFDEYEADDIIGTLSKKFQKDMRVTIWTKDQDCLQLADDNIRVWLITSKCSDMYSQLGVDNKQLNIPSGIFEYTPYYVKHFYGVDPIQIIDRKAIEGDPSDNIPGISGVGEKSVIPLLQEFETVEGIYDFIENSSEKEIKETFKELGISRSPLSRLIEESDTKLVGKKAAFLSKKLATIKCDIEELECVIADELNLEINEDVMKSTFEELGFQGVSQND